MGRLARTRTQASCVCMKISSWNYTLSTPMSDLINLTIDGKPVKERPGT